MPVDFLSAAQIAGYGRYGEAPSARQLERFFHFDDRDRELITNRRGDHNRLGFAVQLATVRFLGTFLARPAEVPPVVATTVARELAISDPGCLALYARREQTHREHAGEIQLAYGYRDFSERTAQAGLIVWLHARAWTTAERPSVLFDLATARLIEARVLLPGASVLARLVAAARDQASDRLYATLADALTASQRTRLRTLLDVVPGEAVSGLERLRAGPRKLTATELLDALLRLRDVQDVGVGRIVVDVPAGRERALARYGLVAKAQALRRMSAKRRDATLLAALWQLELDAADDALLLLDQVLDQLLSQAAREHKAARFKQLPELDRAARRLRAAVLVLLDPPPGGLDALWAAIDARVSRDDLHAASDAIGRLTPPELDTGGQDAAFRAELLRRYPSLRRFLPALLEIMPFEATGAGQPVLDALDALRALEGRPGRVSAASVPLQLVGGQWKRLVLANPQLAAGELDRRAYSFCVLEALQRALDRRDVFVARSGRFTDPRAKLLSGPAWETRQARDLREPQPPLRPRARSRSPRRRARRRVPPDAPRAWTRTSRWRSSASAAWTGPTSARWSASTSPPSSASCASTSTSCCPIASRSRRSCSRSATGRTSPTRSRTSAKAAPASRTCTSASAPSCSPRPATSASPTSRIPAFPR